MLIDTALIRQAHNEIMGMDYDDGPEMPQGFIDHPPRCTCALQGGPNDFLISEEGVPYHVESWPLHYDNCSYLINLKSRALALMAAPCFVNVYLRDRAYGGPEEGGWWYDVAEIRAVYPCPDRIAAHQLIARIEAEGKYSNEGRNSDVSSVLSDGCYTVEIEWTPGENHPPERPHYE